MSAYARRHANPHGSSTDGRSSGRPIDETMFAIRRPGHNAPCGPRRKGEAKPADATAAGGRGLPADPIARFALAAVKLARAGETAGVDALIRLVCGAAAIMAPAPASLPLAKGFEDVATEPRVRTRSAAWHPDARALRAKGLSIETIALRLGRSRGSVYYALKARGAPP